MSEETEDGILCETVQENIDGDTTSVIYVMDQGLAGSEEVEMIEGQIYQVEDGRAFPVHQENMFTEESGTEETAVYEVYEEEHCEDVLGDRQESKEVNEVSIVGEEEIIYVTSGEGETVTMEEGEVAFMQVGGPDVASEETIETSVIVEVPESSEVVQMKGEEQEQSTSATTNSLSSILTSDHCYTFKRGIRPKDLDRAKTTAAMLGGSVNLSPTGAGYTFILPKNPTTQIILPPIDGDVLEPLAKSVSVPGSPAGRPRNTQPRVSKHRWLWQFMKELLFVGDPSLQWFSQREGSFILRDQDSLAIKWECYKRLHKMKAQVWRQMRYYFGWMEENKIVKPVLEIENGFQFHEKFYREKFLPYKFRPHADLAKISQMAADMDPSEDILSRYRAGSKEKIFCVRGCGSQFINKEACTRHEGVCTFTHAPGQELIESPHVL